MQQTLGNRNALASRLSGSQSFALEGKEESNLGCLPIGIVVNFFIAALAQIDIGIDTLDLAKCVRAPTDLELDEMVFGKGGLPPPQQSRDYLRNMPSMALTRQYP